MGFDQTADGARTNLTLSAELRVLEGGAGGAFLFLSLVEFGARGPAPFLSDWTQPNLEKSFAVGIDVHNPKDEDPFRGHGNYQGLPQREVSLHWDGLELVKRVTESEFRGDWTAIEIELKGVAGGSEVSVRRGGSMVFDSFFIAGMEPYELRLGLGAGTRS